MSDAIEWKPGDRALATVRGVPFVAVVRTDDPDLPWHSDERIPDYFGPQTEHPERHVRDARPILEDPEDDQCEEQDGRQYA